MRCTGRLGQTYRPAAWKRSSGGRRFCEAPLTVFPCRRARGGGRLAGRFSRPKGYSQVGASPSRTSPTLLGRLRTDPADQAAWGEFVARYGPKIYGWCRQWNLQETDAQDVTQNVLFRLLRRLQAFEYDPARSFRGWLR